MYGNDQDYSVNPADVFVFSTNGDSIVFLLNASNQFAGTFSIAAAGIYPTLVYLQNQTSSSGDFVIESFVTVTTGPPDLPATQVT